MGKLAPDSRLLLLTEALRTSDWRAAHRHIDEIGKDEVFAFMAPILRAWVAVGSRKGDGVATLDRAAKDRLVGAYAEEQRPLLLLAAGKQKQGLALLAPLIEADDSRATRLRIAAAASFARAGDRNSAVRLLDGESAPIAAARRRVKGGKSVAGAIATPSAGIAEFFLRIAADLKAQDVSQLALSFARLATFLEPANSEGWLATSELLAAQGQPRAALAALERIEPSDPFAGAVANRRISILFDSGAKDQALSEARAAVSADTPSVEAWLRLGDLLSEIERYAEAADAYGRAVTLAKAGSPTVLPQWALWRLKGFALVEAGKWTEGKAALEQAYSLAPRQPAVLNVLGYSQLERRENIAEAAKLIEEAAKLQPDDAAITDSLGWARYVGGDLAKAIELLERAAQAAPAEPAINEHLGDAYYSAGRRWEARYAWRAALPYAEGRAADRLRAKIDSGLKPDLAAP